MSLDTGMAGEAGCQWGPGRVMGTTTECQVPVPPWTHEGNQWTIPGWASLRTALGGTVPPGPCPRRKEKGTAWQVPVLPRVQEWKDHGVVHPRAL